MRVPWQPHKAPGSRALGLLWGPLVSSLLITQGSLEWSLGISIHQDADLWLEAVHPVTYLHLLTYPRSISLQCLLYVEINKVDKM